MSSAGDSPDAPPRLKEKRDEYKNTQKMGRGQSLARKGDRR